MLRKKVKNWKTIPDNEKTAFKSEILNVLMRESEEPVRKQIIWLISTTFKYIVKSKNEWPELLKFINDLILSNNPGQLQVRFSFSIL